MMQSNKANKGKLFGVLNILDLLFLVMVVLVLLFAVRYFNRGKNTKAVGTTYFTVEIRPVKEDYLDKITVGVPVKDSIRDNYLGIIEAVDIEKDKLVNWDGKDGIFIETFSPQDYSMQVRIKANGSQTEGDIFAENMPVKVGKDMSIKGKGFAHVGYIIDVEYVEGVE